MKTGTLTNDVKGNFATWPAGTRVAVKPTNLAFCSIERLENKHGLALMDVMCSVPLNSIQFDSPALEVLTSLPTMAVSVRQPYGQLIVDGLKDVENRTRRTLYRGPVLIHASAFIMSRAAWMDFVDWAFSNSLKNIVTDHPKLMHRGGIIGVADIVDCVSASDSPWFTGPWGWKLANAQPLPFKACKGALGFFKCDYASL